MLCCAQPQVELLADITELHEQLALDGRSALPTHMPHSLLHCQAESLANVYYQAPLTITTLRQHGAR
jgi:hypothetical protein